MSSNSSIKVAVRLRPLNEDESNSQPAVHASSADNKVIALRGFGKAQQRTIYNFDTVFSPSASQREVFDSTLKPVIKEVLFGYESTVFAYGQTGTGKTYTMEGDLENPESYGIIPRSAEYIFNGLNKSDYVSYCVSISSLEIYNEELRDLLADEENIAPYKSPTKSNKPIEIMEGRNGVFCRGLSKIMVDSAEDVLSVIKRSQKHRKVGETKLNMNSSRSHCIYTLHINSKKKVNGRKIFDTHGKLHLVDLAGSECAKAAALDRHDQKKDKKNKSLSSAIDGVNKARGRERGNINRSLLTLGRVIVQLSQRSNKKSVRIPYRDSKLTRMLQDSLGGHCVTVVIATVSPSEKAIEETLSTLYYAQSASGITNKPVPVSYMKSPDARHDYSVSDDDVKGVDHWYKMEQRMLFLQSQLDDAQAELAKQYDDQKDTVFRAERAEEELVAVKGILEKTQGTLQSSVLMLKQSTQVILQQQHDLNKSKTELQQLKQRCVNNVMRGVTDIVEKQMGVLNFKQRESFQKMGESNHALNRSTQEIRSSACDILTEVEKTNLSIFELSNEKVLSDKKMRLEGKLTHDSLRELDMMWSRQRKLVDYFVTHSNEQVDELLVDHEGKLTTISSSIEEDCNMTRNLILDAQNGLNENVAALSNLVNQQNNYVQKSTITSTLKQLDEMRNDNSNATKQFSAVVASINQTLAEDKENLSKVVDKQCALADHLRNIVENKYDGYGNMLAKQRRSNIDARKENMVRSFIDFHDLSNSTLLSTTEKESSAVKANCDRYTTNTLRNWNAVAALPERKAIAYNKELSMTPSDEIILKQNELNR